MVLSVYSPHEVESGAVDGVEVDVVSTPYGGLWRHSATVVVPPQSTVRLELTLVGQLGRVNATNYRLDVWQQPLVQPDTTAITVAVTGSWHIVGARPSEALTQVITPAMQELEVSMMRDGDSS